MDRPHSMPTEYQVLGETVPHYAARKVAPAARDEMPTSKVTPRPDLPLTNSTAPARPRRQTKAVAEPLQFPDEMLAQHLAIVGKAGSGKTYASKGMVERLLQGQRRVCILDPTGVWWGLRVSADGKGDGFPVVVFGGTHADIEISEHSGATLAKVIAARNMPSIIDLSEMLIGDRHRFMTDFAEALYRSNRAPLHLVIDEADEFAPQQPLPETKRMLHHVDRIVRRGRVRGFRVMMITQRPAVLHKNVLTQANTLVAMRLTAPQDRNAIKAWIEGQADIGRGKTVLESLAQLPRGEGWVWAPELGILERMVFPTIESFDSSSTPEDDAALSCAGLSLPVSKSMSGKLAVVNFREIAALLEAGGTKPESGAAPAVSLEAEVVLLRKQLSDSKEALASAGLDTAKVQSDLERERKEWRAEKVKTFREVQGLKAELSRIRDIASAALAIRTEVNGDAFAPDLAAAPKSLTAKSSFAKASTPPAAKAKAPAAVVVAPTSGRSLGTPQQRILDSVAWWVAAGVAQPTRHRVAFVAGYTVNGHFNNLVGTLRTSGFIDYPGGGTLALTDAGAGVATGPSSRPTRAELIARVDAVLKSGPMRKIFAILVQQKMPLSREHLAGLAGYTVNGHFNNLVGSLSGIGVCDYPTRGSVGLSRLFVDLK